MKAGGEEGEGDDGEPEEGKKTKVLLIFSINCNALPGNKEVNMSCGIQKTLLYKMMHCFALYNHDDQIGP